MKNSKKKILTGLAVLIAVSMLMSVSLAADAKKTFTTKGGAVYEAVDIGGINGIVPLNEYPDQMPPILIDGRTYVPLRAAIQAAGGDVGWVPDLKTAFVQTADGILIMKDGALATTVHKGDTGVKFVSSISYILLPSTQFDYYWVLEKDGKEVEKTAVTTKDTGDDGVIICEYDAQQQKFDDSGKYSLKVYYRIHGGSTWYNVARRNFTIR